MTSPDWVTIGTVASIVTLLMSGFLWLLNKIFNLGRTSQRLDSIETSLSEFKQDVSSQFKGVRQGISTARNELSDEIHALGARMDQRIDKLILTLPETNTN